MLTGMRAMDMEGRISYVNPAFCAMTGFSESRPDRPACRPSPTGRTDRREENARLLEQELQGTQPGRRHRGQGDAQGRLAVRRAHVRLAADRPEGPADRLDDVDDQHHRGQADPRPAHRLARALHDRARGARRRGVGALGAAGRAAVRQPLVPALVRRRWRRATRSSPAATPRCPLHADGDDAVDGLGGLPTQELTAAGSDSREVFVDEPGEVVRRPRALPAVDRRPARADADRHRHHRAAQRRGARRAARPRRRR